MIKQILKNLIFTFLLSSATAVVALSLNHHFLDVVDFDSDFKGLLEFAVVSYLVLTIFSLPALLLTKKNIWKKPVLRFIVYYFGTVIPLISVTMPILREHKYAEDWLGIMIIAIFIIIHTFFYIKLVKKGFLST